MQAQQNYKKEYDETLLVYSKKKTETANLAKNINNLENLIANLIVELTKPLAQSILPNILQPQPQPDNAEVDGLTGQLEELTRLINEQQEQIERDNNNFSNLQRQLKGSRHNDKPSVALDREQLNRVEGQMKEAQISIQEISKSLEASSFQLKSYEVKANELSGQISRLQDVREQGPEDNSRNIEEELRHLQQQQRSLTEQINLAKKQLKKQQQELKSGKATLATLEKDKNGLVNKKNDLQKIKSTNQSEKVNELQSEIKRLQSTNNQLQKNIQTLSQWIQAKKAQKAAQKQELKKYKEKKEKNYKLQIAEAEKTQQSLNKQIEREKQKLAGVSKLTKSYVSQQNLQILQKELGRHQAIFNKFNLQAEQARKNKLVRQNEILKSRISHLQQASKSLEQQTESAVRELRKEGDELVKQKLAQQKVFNQITNKLNYYLKEFPDHEKKKEAQKLQEKKRRQQQKLNLRQALKAEREKKEQQRKQKAKQSEILIPEADDSKTGSLPQLPPQQELSIFNNRQFQLVAGVVALLAILLLTLG